MNTMQCVVCHSSVAIGTCNVCAAGVFCGNMCFASSGHVCDHVPRTDELQFTLESGSVAIRTLGNIKATFDAAAFIKLNKRIGAGPLHADYRYGQYSIYDDELIYGCFAAMGQYELVVKIWLPDYIRMADKDLKWLENELASYAPDKTRTENPSLRRPIDPRVAWLMRRERRAIYDNASDIAHKLETDEMTREGCVHELIRLNPMTVRQDDVVVALVEEYMLQSTVHMPTPDWTKHPLLYHTGYRSALLSVIRRSRVFEDSTPSSFYRFLQQRNILAFGGLIADKTFLSTRFVTRADPGSMNDVVAEVNKSADTQSHIFSWNRTDRRVVDELLERTWQFVGSLLSYMTTNFRSLEHEFRRAIAPHQIEKVYALYRNGKFFLYEWFGVPDQAWAWSNHYIDGKAAQRYIGYGIQVRNGDDSKNVKFYSSDALIGVVIHELSHTFTIPQSDANAKYPSSWFANRMRDSAHSPMFVLAYEALITIAFRSGLTFPSQVAHSARAFELYIDSILKKPVDRATARAALGLPLLDENETERVRRYDNVIKHAWIANNQDDPMERDSVDTLDLGNIKTRLLSALSNENMVDADIILRNFTPAWSGLVLDIFDQLVQLHTWPSVIHLLRTPRIVPVLLPTLIKTLENQLVYYVEEVVKVVIGDGLLRLDMESHVNDLYNIARYGHATMIIRFLAELLTGAAYMDKFSRAQIAQLLDHVILQNHQALVATVLAHPLSGSTEELHVLIKAAMEGTMLNSIVALIMDTRVDIQREHKYLIVRSVELGYFGLLKILLKPPHNLDPSIDNSRALIAAHFLSGVRIEPLLRADPRINLRVIEELPPGYTYRSEYKS